MSQPNLINLHYLNFFGVGAIMFKIFESILLEPIVMVLRFSSINIGPALVLPLPTCPLRSLSSLNRCYPT
jgi:hypothetical protein